MHIARKGITRGLAIIYLSLALVAPAKAFMPVAVIAAPAIYASGSTYAVSALAGLVGLVGGYLLLKDATNNEVRVPLGPNEQNKPAAPSAPATTTQTGGVMECGRWVTSSQPYQYTEPMCAGSGIANCPGTMIGGVCYVNDIDYRSYQVTVNGTVGTCPSGYATNGGGCQLVNARQAVADQKCDLLINMGQFATADDLDCDATSNGQKLSPMIRDGKAMAYGTNSSGQPLLFEVTPGTSRYTVKQMEQIQTATQTQVKTTTISVDTATSTITSVETSTAPGSISSPAAQTLPTAQPTTTTAENTPTVTTRPGEQVQTDQNNTPNCGLPGTPACAIDDSGFANLPKPWESADKPDFEAPKKTALDNYTDPSFEWSQLRPSILPGTAVTCTPLEFRGKVSVGPAAGLDSTSTLDVCWAFEIIRVMLGYIFFASTLLYLWRTFIGAEATPVSKG